MEMHVSKFRRLVQEFQAFLGEEHFSLLIGDFSPGSTRGLRAYQQHADAAHPFALWWTQLQKDVGKSETAGAFVLGDSSVFLLDLYENLKQASVDPNYPELLKRLVVPQQFHSASFEAFIYAAYKRQGYPIAFVPTAAGVRTPDFQIEVNGERLSIECKSMQDPSEEEARIWFSICAGISKKLLEHKLSWRVGFRPDRYISGRDQQAILQATIARIANRGMEAAEIVEGIHFVAEPLDTEWPVARRTELGWVEVDLKREADGKQTVVGGALVEVQPYFDPDASDKINGLLEEAYGQLSKDCPGMVYIQIPSRVSNRFLAIADRAFNRTFGRLRKNFPRIGAVGLVGRAIDANMKEGGVPILDYVAVIPNPAPSIKLHKWFKVLEASTQEGVEIGPEGTLVLEFIIKERLPKQLGKSLYKYCSNDGQIQLRLWQSFENVFRADAVHPSYGRITFRADLNWLEVGASHKLAIAFGRDSMRLAVRGKIIEPIPS